MLAISVWYMHQAVKRLQVQIDIIPEDGEGDIDVAALERMLSNGTQAPALIAITHIPTSSGRSRSCKPVRKHTMRRQ